MEIAGYLAALMIGLSLGLIGGGGSILTLPVLVYLFGVSPSLATAYSLAIVGVTSLVGAAFYLRARLVDLRVAAAFGPPSIAAVYAVRAYLLPAMPETLSLGGGFAVSRDHVILFLFAALMVGAGWKMIRPGEVAPPEEGKRGGYGLVVVEGVLVGGLTGLVGAGGGFLIVPALVLLAGLPMRMAAGTSLLLIAAKSLIGFGGDLQSGTLIDWPLLGSIIGLALAGIFVGFALARRISAQRLQAGFGWFVLAMAAFIVVRELLVGSV
jgi:uncharacterized membrane protein YfcA